MFNCKKHFIDQLKKKWNQFYDNKHAKSKSIIKDWSKLLYVKTKKYLKFAF